MGLACLGRGLGKGVKSRDIVHRDPGLIFPGFTLPGQKTLDVPAIQPKRQSNLIFMSPFSHHTTSIYKRKRGMSEKPEINILPGQLELPFDSKPLDRKVVVIKRSDKPMGDELGDPITESIV